MDKTLVYIAGPYRGAVDANVSAAIDWGEQVHRVGHRRGRRLGRRIQMANGTTLRPPQHNPIGGENDMRCLVHGYDGHDRDDVARQPGCVTWRG